jgi:hypothetical protein
MAAALDYSAAPVPVRKDIQDSQQRVWKHLASPGSWLSGAERLSIATESRNAPECRLCRERKDAVSPNAVRGEHDSVTELPETLVDVIHRVRNDPGRLSRSWFDATLASGLDKGRYVEAVGIVTLLAGADFFCRALGIPAHRLPEAVSGEPSGQRPEGLSDGGAWVPMLAPENASGADANLYGGEAFVPNIVRALSSVPSHVSALLGTMAALYIPPGGLLDFTMRRDLDRLQIELVASRVSAMNECFY